MFEVSFRFLMVIIPKTLPLSRIFQDIFNDKLYFSVAQKFVDFVIFTCSGVRGNSEWKMKKFTLQWFLIKFNPLILFQNFFHENHDVLILIETDKL